MDTSERAREVVQSLRTRWNIPAEGARLANAGRITIEEQDGEVCVTAQIRGKPGGGVSIAALRVLSALTDAGLIRTPTPRPPDAGS